MVKPLDDSLNLEGFAGFESEKVCNLGQGFGAIPKLPIIKELRDCYVSLHFVKEDGTLNKIPSPQYQTECLVKKGLILNNTKQTVNDLTIYPIEYFCPKDFYSGEINLTENTYSIHHFDGSWVDSGLGLIRKEYLSSLGIIFTAEEENMYLGLMHNKKVVKSQQDLFDAVNMAQKIFFTADTLCKDNKLRNAIKELLFLISENGVKNKVTSLGLYFTIFRKWKVFKTPRANLRYLYHCFRNLLHV